MDIQPSYPVVVTDTSMPVVIFTYETSASRSCLNQPGLFILNHRVNGLSRWPS